MLLEGVPLDNGSLMFNICTVWAGTLYITLLASEGEDIEIDTLLARSRVFREEARLKFELRGVFLVSRILYVPMNLTATCR